MILCEQCHTEYPKTGAPFRCNSCGGDYVSDRLPGIDFDKTESGLPGIWKYRHSFFAEDTLVISMGEGDTPLILLDPESEIYGKMESQNPSGSYKDRAMSLIVSHVVSRGATKAVEDSSGNAGASFAAYAARAGIQGRVFVPAATGQAKIDQIEVYGAEVVKVEGPRANAAAAVMHEAENGCVYASHAYLPFGIPGIATIAYEIYFQLNQQIPGTVIAPVGHGHLMRGIIDGFKAIKEYGAITELPYFVGVQAERCAPIEMAWKNGKKEIRVVGAQHTIAEGTAVTTPRQGKALLDIFKEGIGEFLAVPEDEIITSFHELARRGIYIEPTSAMVWAVTKQFHKLPKPVVLVLTGNGLKYTIEH